MEISKVPPVPATMDVPLGPQVTRSLEKVSESEQPGCPERVPLKTLTPEHPPPSEDTAALSENPIDTVSYVRLATSEPVLDAPPEHVALPVQMLKVSAVPSYLHRLRKF